MPVNGDLSTRLVLCSLPCSQSRHMDFNFPYKYGAGIAPLLRHVSGGCVDLIAQMCTYDPDARLTAKQALRHSYFKDLRYPLVLVLLLVWFGWHIWCQCVLPNARDMSLHYTAVNVDLVSLSPLSLPPPPSSTICVYNIMHYALAFVLLGRLREEPNG